MIYVPHTVSVFGDDTHWELACQERQQAVNRATDVAEVLMEQGVDPKEIKVSVDEYENAEEKVFVKSWSPQRLYIVAGRSEEDVDTYGLNPNVVYSEHDEPMNACWSLSDAKSEAEFASMSFGGRVRVLLSNIFLPADRDYSPFFAAPFARQCEDEYTKHPYRCIMSAENVAVVADYIGGHEVRNPDLDQRPLDWMYHIRG